MAARGGLAARAAVHVHSSLEPRQTEHSLAEQWQRFIGTRQFEHVGLGMTLRGLCEPPSDAESPPGRAIDRATLPPLSFRSCWPLKRPGHTSAGVGGSSSASSSEDEEGSTTCVKRSRMPMHGLEGGSREGGGGEDRSREGRREGGGREGGRSDRTDRLRKTREREVTCRSNGRYRYRNCSNVLRSHTQSQSVPQPRSSYMYKYKY